MSNIEAEKSFWMTPELMESLLSFLDPGSILALAKSLGKTHSLNTKLLLSGTVWTKFLERSFPKQSSTLRLCFPCMEMENTIAEWTTYAWLPPHFARGQTNIHPSIVLEPIIEILLLIGKPESHLLQLLDLICKRFPPYIPELGTYYYPVRVPDHVKVVCPCHEVHDVSPFGFGLLEKVERSTDTCRQQVDEIRMKSMCIEHVKSACGPILSALKSRMARQGGQIAKTEFYEFVFATQEDVEVFLALAKNVDSISFQKLVVILLIISFLIFLIISY